MVDAPTDEQLLGDYFGGDRSGFDTLVRRYHQELYRFALRFTNSSAAAEDVVQEAFLQVHLAGSSFDLSRRFKPWLFTIAANKARDWLRARTRRHEVPLDAPIDGGDQGGESFGGILAGDDDPVDEALEAEEQRRVVQRVVREMPDHLREVLVLGYFHRFAYKEMADILEVPLGTIKSRLHAAVGHFARRYRAVAKEARAPDDVLEGELWKEV